MRSLLNKLFRRMGFELRSTATAYPGDCVSLKTDGPCKGNVLVAYIVEPFLLSEHEAPSTAHTHHVESLLIAEAFLQCGYNVDVIDYRNGNFRPRKDYRFLFSARTNLAKLAARMNKTCIRIAHLDTAHFLFNNASAYARLLELQRRRGITCTSIRVIEHNYAVEHADYLTMLGNAFTESTYSYSGKPVFPLPVPTPVLYPDRTIEDMASCRNRFLWLGSSGFVHKGLDLVLEAFTEMPECHLTVCGPLDAPSEKAFCDAFHRELYETPNVEAMGWVDTGSQEFIDISRNCCALIYPSCSEGQAGAVVTCLQAGLVPLVSYESGVDVGDFGRILGRVTTEEIKAVVREISAQSERQLLGMCQGAQEYARENHCRENYLKKLVEIVDYIERNPISG